MFDNHFSPSFTNNSNDFHIEPFVTNSTTTNEYELPPGLITNNQPGISQPFISSDKEFSFQHMSNGQETNHISPFVSFNSPFSYPSLDQVCL